MASHASTNFERQQYYQDKSKCLFKKLFYFKLFYSRNNFSKIKDGAYKKNLDSFESIGTHSIALYVNAKSLTYFDSFWSCIPKKLENLLQIKIF